MKTWAIRRKLRPVLLPVRSVDAWLRSLPDFVVIGAQRAGSTTLYAALIRHPQVRRALIKEIHFFDLNYGRGERWYRAHFPHRSDGSITGEASPYYLFHPQVPKRVADMLPDTRFIVLLRDPVARAYSHYQHQVRLGREPLSFEEAIDAEDERLQAEADRLERGENFVSGAHQYFSYAARGRYAEQLERWFEVIPRERFFVVASETMFSSPDETYGRIAAFLGLSRHELSRFPRAGAGKYARLAPATEQRLREYFEPQNERLRRLLDEPLPWARAGY
jgi:hypothetical protein